MIWSKEPGLFEIGGAVIFLLLYLGFFIRIWIISRQVKSDFRPVFLKFILRSIYLFLLFIALLGPSFGDIRKELKTVGKDIYFLVDLSKSMNAKDISPSRIEKVKHELSGFISSLDADRIGIIIFTSEAFVHCPLTFDVNALNLFVTSLSTELISDGSTDFDKPLNLVLKEFMKEAKVKDDKKEKIAILISDGENQTEINLQKATILLKNGIRLYTLGVGTRKGEKIPTLTGVKKDDLGLPVISQLNTQTLNNLASLGGGKFYEISERTNESEYLISNINKLQGEIKRVRKIDSAANKYYYFVLFAVILVICDLLFTVRTVKI